MGIGCPRCHSAVALHEGRPVVTPTGAVELWHQRCFERRDQLSLPLPLIAPSGTSVVTAPPRTVVRKLAIGGFALALVAAAGGLAASAHDDTSATLVNLEAQDAEPLALPSAIATHYVAPPAKVELSLEEKYPMPTTDGVPLDETYPSLQSWVHPVTNSAELMPVLASRHFGSERVGIERSECGAGHCGIDLDAPRGRPLVAVAGGVVIRVERKEMGSDGRSGRYVRIQHDDGAITAYMHMDDVADELQTGNHVLAGQYIGTLGATAVFSAPPHCHFSLEIPDHPGDRGDTTHTHYVDPAPFLVRSTIAKTPERRHAIKPAF